MSHPGPSFKLPVIPGPGYPFPGIVFAGGPMAMTSLSGLVLLVLAQAGFPGPAAAREAIVDDREEPYFDLLRPHDMSAKTGSPVAGGTIQARRDECRRRYRAAVLEFTDPEKAFLRRVTEMLHPALADYPRLAALPWSFLKVDSSIEGGLPHTRGAHIVLPEPVMRGYEKARKASEEQAAAAAAGLLVHEQVHVLQRKQPEVFEDLYVRVWGFKRAPRIAGGPWLEAHEVVNPDATDCGWAFPIRSDAGVRWIWPRVIFDGPEPGPGKVFRMPEDFRMAAVELEEEAGGGFRVRLDEKGKPLMSDLLEVPEYVRAFSGSRYIYHPAEAAADLFKTIVMFDAFTPKDRLTAEARESAEKRLGPLRSWFRVHLK